MAEDHAEMGVLTILLRRRTPRKYRGGFVTEKKSKHNQPAVILNQRRAPTDHSSDEHPRAHVDARFDARKNRVAGTARGQTNPEARNTLTIRRSCLVC
jgi:hypothetical protein